MIRAVFFDVDGTLFSHATNQVPQSARDAVAELRRHGIAVGLATGRSLVELRDLPLHDISFDVLLTLNGQLVLDGEGNVVEGNPLTGEGLNTVLELFASREVPVLLVEQNRLYLNYVDDAVRAAQEAIRTPIPEIGSYVGGAVYQANIFVDASREDEFVARLSNCDVTRWHDQALDINAPSEGGKAAGIARWAAAHGIAQAEVAAFGDGENDLPMLRWAGVGVCMGNGSGEAKEAADLVTSDIDEDGVVHALQELSLL